MPRQVLTAAAKCYRCRKDLSVGTVVDIWDNPKTDKYRVYGIECCEDATWWDHLYALKYILTREGFKTISEIPADFSDRGKQLGKWARLQRRSVHDGTLDAARARALTAHGTDA